MVPTYRELKGKFVGYSVFLGDTPYYFHGKTAPRGR